MSAERCPFTSHDLDRLADLVSERVLARVTERGVPSSINNRVSPTDADLATQIALALIDGPSRLVDLVSERVLARLEERQVVPTTGRQPPNQSDVAAQIASALVNGPATVPELARRARLRDETVRKVLQTDPRFLRVPPPSERSPKAKCWTMASGVVLEARTSPDDLQKRSEDAS
jgi:hypothetical protein